MLLHKYIMHSHLSLQDINGCKLSYDNFHFSFYFPF